MATAAQWFEGIRLRTLPAATSPVLAGTGVAWFEGHFQPLLAVLTLVVSLLIQIGANLSNDYSDGIRGSDHVRVGPMRLVGSGAAPASHVRAAAFGAYGAACLVGLVVVVLTGYWGLIFVGAACVVAAWLYTGGKHPYGYVGLGEVFVFVFFGLVAVVGTVYIQVGALSAATWWAGAAIGILAVAILVANNLRDIAGDQAVGKMTLATHMGDKATRWLFVATVVVALVCVFGVAATSSWWALLGWVMIALFVVPLRDVLTGMTGRGLIPVLRQTGLAELACAVGLLVGLIVAA